MLEVILSSAHLLLLLLSACTSPSPGPLATKTSRPGLPFPGALLASKPSQALEDRETIAFGLDVDGGADLDGDGKLDVVVGAPGGSYARGRVLVHAGRGAGVGAIAARSERGTDSCFGQEVAIVGDLNGDGHPDLIWNDSCTFENDARVNVKFGGPGVFDDPLDQTRVGARYSGFRADPAGDVNGDGLADVLIGVFGENPEDGRLALHLGTPLGLSETPVHVLGPTVSRRIVGNVAAALDLDGDGHADLVVEELPTDMAETYTRVVAWRGGPNGYESQPWRVWEGLVDEGFGGRIESAGDVNADGIDDLLISVFWDHNGRGAVEVYLGGPNGPSQVPDQVLLGDQRNGLFGDAMLGAGDLNGDGYGDVLVQSYPSHGKLNRVYAFAGGPTGLELTPRQVIDANQPRDMFGYAMARAGDMNGDGRADVWISAYNEELDDDYPGEGRVYLYAGALDSDGDGSPSDADCDDEDSSVHPGAADVPRDGIDQDCDGLEPDPEADTDPPDSGGDSGSTDNGGSDDKPKR